MASSLSSPFEIKCSHPVQPSSSFDSLFFEYLSTVRVKSSRENLPLSLSALYAISLRSSLFYKRKIFITVARKRAIERFEVSSKFSSHFADFPSILLAPTYTNPLHLSHYPRSRCFLSSPSDVRSSMVTRARYKIFTD